MILGTCRTYSRTIRLRGLFMCEANKEDTDTELFTFVCHVMKPAANDQLRHMPSKLLHISKSKLFKRQRRTVR